MTVSAQIPERDTAPALSVPPIETAVKRKNGFWPPFLSNFPQSAEWQTFREDAYHRLFFVPFYDDLFPYIE